MKSDAALRLFPIRSGSGPRCSLKVLGNLPWYKNLPKVRWCFQPGPQAVERCKLAVTCHRGTEQPTAWCDLATEARWEGLEEAVSGAGPWWSYVSPFSMRPSCSSRRLIRSPCSLTSIRSARSSCITSSSFPASPAPARLPLGTSVTAVAVEAPERL